MPQGLITNLERGISDDVVAERAFAQQEIQGAVEVLIAAIDDIGGVDLVAASPCSVGTSPYAAKRDPLKPNECSSSKRRSEHHCGSTENPLFSLRQICATNG